MTNERGKNLRLSYDAWQELRRVKFAIGAVSYSAVLDEVFKHYNGFEALSDDVRSKVPSDTGDTKKSSDRSDKTIVVESQIHDQLLRIKNEYMLEKGFASRGPNAVSVSDILLDLLKAYKNKLDRR